MNCGQVLAIAARNEARNLAAVNDEETGESTDRTLSDCDPFFDDNPLAT